MSIGELRDLDRWGQCEAYALSTPIRMGGTPVALWVNHMAVANLDGGAVETPPMVRFDATTPSATDARIQADAIATAAKFALDSRGWTILPRDAWTSKNGGLYVWNRVRQGAVLMLVTEREVGSAWLAAGALAWPLPDARWGGIIHAPRMGSGRDQRAAVELRDSLVLKAQWERRDDRITAVLAGDTPMRTPGEHCRRCAQVSACPVATPIRN